MKTLILCCKASALSSFDFTLSMALCIVKFFLCPFASDLKRGVTSLPFVLLLGDLIDVRNAIDVCLPKV